MASTFAALRAKQQKSPQDLQKKFQDAKGGAKDPTEDDVTFWSPKHIRGADGNGLAVIRFLPALENDEEFVRIWEYVFKGPSGKWYINLSRQTLGNSESDPAYEYNGKLFADKSMTKEQRAKKLLKRNTNYVANIYVVKDPQKPENEGKVFKWKFGGQIFNIIEDAMFPKQLEGEEEVRDPIAVFDPFEGRNFTVRAYTKSIPNTRGEGNVDVPSYEKSSFGTKNTALCSEEEFEAIFAQQYSLKELISEDKFKSYAELKVIFDAAMGTEKKNFLDSDEPIGPGKTEEVKQERVQSFKEKISDEIPDFESHNTENPAPEEEVSSQPVESGDDDDNWFNELKK